jgi:mannan endo-1,4-beta-mannosidase
MSRRNALLFVVAVMSVVGLLEPAGRAAAVPAGFITRDGTQLILDGQPFRFTGVDIYNANSDGWCGAQMNTGSTLDDALTAIGPGKRVFRAWFFQPLATTKDASPHRDWSGFDHTLQVAADHGMKVIVTLTDQWGECGTNVAGNGYKTADWYTTGYEQIQPGMLESYRDWVHDVVTRYRDDPTVAFWQLINEAETDTFQGAGCLDSVQSYQVIHDWAADVSGMVKAIDPDHLVSLGTIGSGQCGTDGPRYQDLHAISTIDLCEFHDYGSPLVGIPGDQWNGMQVRIDQCDALNKPIFVGEAGIIPDDIGGTLQARADAFRAKIDAQFAAGVRGFLAWAWSPQTTPVSTLDNYDMGPGDPAFDALVFPRYDLGGGFLAPIDEGFVNVAKAGKAIPVKWRLLDTSGQPVDDAASFRSLTSEPVRCRSLSGHKDVIESYAKQGSGLTSLGDGRWEIDWQTAGSWRGTCRVMTITFLDWSAHLAAFKFR